MRILAILMLLAALGVGVVWPRVQVQLLGNQLAELEFDTLRSAREPVAREIELSRNDNPVRIGFQAKYMVGAKLPPVSVRIKAVITDAEGTLLSGFLSFPTDGISTGPEQPAIRGSQPLIFSVLNDGVHTLYLSLAENPNDGGIETPDIASVTATVIANVPEQDDNIRALSAVLALLGIYLFFRSMRRRPAGPKSDPPQRWGRGG